MVNKEMLLNIKLVIWDLDETLWNGTIDDGDQIIIPEINKKFIKALNDRGIINSICSKNNIQNVNNILEKESLRDSFVFVSADWSAKGQRIKDLLYTIGLRPVNVLFIDDNNLNLEEVAYCNPGIMCATPFDIRNFYDIIVNSNLKIDLEHKRIKQYRLLEKKYIEKSTYASNKDFLFSCNILVDINYECINEIDRIHELVMRSNQLNFTKRRSSKDELQKILTDKQYRCGTVHVKDKFGDYGMVGFFALINNECEHFLFSCRTIGMGIEQYVYDILGRPKISIVGEVVSSLYEKESLLWINQGKFTSKNKTNRVKILPHSVLFKGPCDMSQIFNYMDGSKIDTEFTFVDEDTKVSIQGAQHSTHIVEYLTLSENEKNIIKNLPFGSKDFFTTNIFNHKYKYIFLSTLHESHLCQYINKMNGSKVVFGEAEYSLTNKDNAFKYISSDIYTGNCQFTQEIIKNFSENWEYIGVIPLEEFKSNILFILDHIAPDAKLILLLGPERPYEKNDNPAFENSHIIFQQHNRMIIELAKTNPRLLYLKYDDYIKGQSDFNKNIYHYQQVVYYRIANAISHFLGIEINRSSKCKKLIKKFLWVVRKCFHR